MSNCGDGSMSAGDPAVGVESESFDDDDEFSNYSGLEEDDEV